jgi:hypothetical protein
LSRLTLSNLKHQRYGGGHGHVRGVVTKFGGAGAFIDGLGELAGLVADSLASAVGNPGVIAAEGGRFPLEAAADAYAALAAGAGGKVLVLP